MLDLAVAAALQHVQLPENVGIGVGVRVFQRVAHARLRGEMNDAVGPLLKERLRRSRFAVGEIGADKAKAVAPLKLREPCFFSRTS